MSTKYMFAIVAVVLGIVFIFNRMGGERESNTNGNDKEAISFVFNNNSKSCLPYDALPNYQRFWDYLTQSGAADADGQALFFLSETYSELAKLISSAHVDLYDQPVYDKAHPVFPISQLLPNSKTVDKIMEFEKMVAENASKSLFQLGSVIEVDLLKSSDAKDILEVDDYYFANTKNILNHAKWARSTSTEKLFQKLLNEKLPSPDAYRSWLLLIRISDETPVNLESLPLHQSYVKGLADSLLSDYSPLGMMFDAMPMILRSKWLTKDNVVNTLNTYETGYGETIAPLLTILGENESEIEALLETDLSEHGIYEDIMLSSRFVDHLCKYYYDKGEYGKAMTEITHFWYDDMSNHPMEWMCFDNYPTFLIRSYLYGRWDGARLPLFLQDYRNVMGTDPILRAGFGFFQRYNSEISRTFENTIN